MAYSPHSMDDAVVDVLFSWCGVELDSFEANMPSNSPPSWPVSDDIHMWVERDFDSMVDELSELEPAFIPELFRSSNSIIAFVSVNYRRWAVGGGIRSRTYLESLVFDHKIAPVDTFCSQYADWSCRDKSVHRACSLPTNVELPSELLALSRIATASTSTRMLSNSIGLSRKAERVARAVTAHNVIVDEDRRKRTYFVNMEWINSSYTKAPPLTRAYCIATKSCVPIMEFVEYAVLEVEWQYVSYFVIDEDFSTSVSVRIINDRLCVEYADVCVSYTSLSSTRGVYMMRYLTTEMPS